MDEELWGALAGRKTGWDERFVDLVVFPVDAAVPLELVARYWQATGGLSAAESRGLCEALSELGLARIERGDGEGSEGGHDECLRLPEASGVALRRRADGAVVGLQRRFLDVVRGDVGVDDDGSTRWWELPADRLYLWRYLTYHLAAAEGTDAAGGEVDRLLGDLRWVVAQLERSGLAVLDADLARSDSPWARRLRWRCAQAGHLFTPVEPAHGAVMTLLGCLDGDEMFTTATAQYRAAATVAQLIPVWPLTEPSVGPVSRAPAPTAPP